MLTAKGKYGLKALAHLAALKPGATTQAVEIAKANNIPKKFLDAILGELRNAGMVYSRKGPGGGYMLARAAGDIKLGRVIRAVDGPLAPIACASRSAYEPCRDCKSVRSCAVRLTMTKVRDAVSELPIEGAERENLLTTLPLQSFAQGDGRIHPSPHCSVSAR